MRLAAAEKLGYYPAAPDACEGLLQHLKLGPATDKMTECYVIDPCAGEGLFLQQLAEGLSVPQKNVHAIELDKGRGEAIRALMPSAQVLAPCSLFQTLIAPRSFGLIYVNPPFDHQGLGRSGREETEFVKESYNLLADNGVIVVVAPLQTYKGRDFLTYLDRHFKSMMLFRFPEPIYNEVVMIGVKRNTPRSESDYSAVGFLYEAYSLGDRWNRDYDYDAGRYAGINSVTDLPALGTAGPSWLKGHPVKPPVRPMTKEDAGRYHDDEIRVWEIPPSFRPSRFAKGNYTDEELVEALLESPNNHLFRETSEPPIQESPLPLDRGHVALLVTSGALDGLIETPTGNHVMRGISRKVEKLNEEACKATLSEDGLSMKMVEVYSEEMDTRIRAVDHTNAIYTFSMSPRTIEGCEREYEVKIEMVEECEGFDTVSLERDLGVNFIKCRLNDEEDVKFNFDSGAADVCINGELADRLQLLRTGQRKHYSNADGQTSSSPIMIIGSLRVGRFLIRNVRCCVKENPGEHFSCLLGQNVLRLFDYSTSQADNSVTFTLINQSEAA